MNNLTDQEYCDLLNGLNLLIETHDSMSGHSENTDEWQRLIKLSEKIYLSLICRPKNTVKQCDHCDGDHQYVLNAHYGYDDTVWCDRCSEESFDRSQRTSNGAGGNYVEEQYLEARYEKYGV